MQLLVLLMMDGAFLHSQLTEFPSIAFRKNLFCPENASRLLCTVVVNVGFLPPSEKYFCSSPDQANGYGIKKSVSRAAAGIVQEN